MKTLSILLVLTLSTISICTAEPLSLCETDAECEEYEWIVADTDTESYSIALLVKEYIGDADTPTIMAWLQNECGSIISIDDKLSCIAYHIEGGGEGE